MNPSCYKKIFVKGNCQSGSVLPRCQSKEDDTVSYKTDKVTKVKSKPSIRRIIGVPGREIAKQFLTWVLQGNPKVCSKPGVFILKDWLILVLN